MGMGRERWLLSSDRGEQCIKNKPARREAPWRLVLFTRWFNYPVRMVHRLGDCVAVSADQSSQHLYWTNFHQICRVGRTMTVDDDLKLVFRSLKGRCRGNHFLLALSFFSDRIGCWSHSLDGGVRQEVQVLRLTQANQLTDQLVIINRGWATDRLCFASSLFS